MKLRRLFFAVALLCGLSVVAQEVGEVTLMGCLYNRHDQNGDAMQNVYIPGQGTVSDYGVWAYTLNADGTFKELKQVKSNTVMYPNSGAIQARGYYYTIYSHEAEYPTADSDMEFVVRKWDTNTWAQVDVKRFPGNKTLSARDLCYDPIDDVVYGVFMVTNGSGSDANSGYKLCTLDLETFETTPITPLYFQNVFVALAVSPEGKLFGIDTDGGFYEFNKQTGVPSLKGNVGFKTQYERKQTATFDQRTGKMYWFAFMNTEYTPDRVKRTYATGLYDTGLYEVNTETGEATLIHKFDLCDQVLGCYVLGGDQKQEYDLKVELTSSPLQIAVGEEGTFTAMVKNIGTQPASGYTVNLINNGLVVASQEGEELQPDQSKVYTFTYEARQSDPKNSKFQAQIVDPRDNVERNNITPLVDVRILLSNFPPVDLQGRLKDGEVTLMWEVPDLDGVVTDDAESYAPFIIDGIGPWTMVDLDKGYCQSFSSMGGHHSFPNWNAQKSFQVFSPVEAGLSLDQTVDETGELVDSQFLPHSGDQVFASFHSAIPDNTEAGGHMIDRDDWMISPELTGEAQTIKFWGKSYHSQGYTTGSPFDYEEKVRVCYSTTDKNPENFIQVGEVITVPAKWTEFAIELPEGAKYFALNCVSDADQFFLYIDDITYSVKAPTLTGFNVYRDGELVETIEASNEEEIYTYVEALTGSAAYNVTAVYTEGESAFSNTLVFTNEQGVFGDVNLDGAVSAADLAIIVNIIAGLDNKENYDGRADLNNDGEVTSVDLAIIVNIMAGLDPYASE